MIVRDEEAFLGGCLASVEGAVDEMIVVDTGSQDATKRIAREAGAQVFDFPWCDDFAAARNASLRHATGDWVLILDGDERLARESVSVLRGSLEGATFDCGLLRLHNAPSLEMGPEDVLRWGKEQPEAPRIPRLLRNTDGLAFVDSIHETATPWLRRRGSRFAPLDVHIIHYGAVEEVALRKSKEERNVRILKARLARDPTDVVAYAYLTRQLISLGAIVEATETADRGWRHVSHVTINLAPAVQCFAAGRVPLLLAAARTVEARETIRVARLREGDSLDLRFLDGLVSETEASREQANPDEQRGSLESARSSFRACIETVLSPLATAYIAGASTWLGFTRLGTVELLLGHPADAREAFERALATRPLAIEPRLGLAEATLDLGDAAKALVYLDDLLQGAKVQNGDADAAEGAANGERVAPDVWILAAAAAQRLGLTTHFQLFQRRAMAVLANGFVARHRGRRLKDLLRGGQSA
jgi:tetratricopeptide (TPR) repeat protein